MGKHKINDKHFVYKIKENKTDKVVYIGETFQPTIRWNAHSKDIGPFPKGLYYMDVIDEYVFLSKKDAFNYQCVLQKHYGFQTDFEKLKKSNFDKRKKILCYSYSTNKFIKEYESVRSACRILKISGGNVHAVLNKTRNHTHGYRFEYVE